VQDVDSLNGKVLRIDPATGLGLPDNPFYDGDPGSNESKVFQLGLRNPFRMSVDQQTGHTWLGEVGYYIYEEINTGGAGSNFGWPFYEGATGVNVKQPLYAQLPEAQAFYNSGLPITAAVAAFPHVAQAGEIPIQAIIAGDIYTGNVYPGALQNDLFFTDFINGKIYHIDINDPSAQVGTLGDIGNGIADFVQGPDGYMYALDLFDGQVLRLNITATPSTPGTPLTFDFGNFANVGALTLNGSAAAAGNALQLTPPAAGQAGSAFYDAPMQVTASTSFSTQFQFRLSGGDGANGADGFTFVVQNDPRGVTSLGAQGGSLGYDNQEYAGTTAISRSIAIAFDTYKNGWDTVGNKVALLHQGQVDTPLAIAAAPVDLNSGAALNAWVDYNGSTDRLDVYLSSGGVKPGAALLSATVDLFAEVGSSAHVGFTGGTGGLTNDQDIISWHFTSQDTLIT
jgi:hypothetical protein